jgi:hypothetical protein
MRLPSARRVMPPLKRCTDRESATDRNSSEVGLCTSPSTVTNCITPGTISKSPSSSTRSSGEPGRARNTRGRSIASRPTGSMVRARTATIVPPPWCRRSGARRPGPPALRARQDPLPCAARAHESVVPRAPAGAPREHRAIGECAIRQAAGPLHDRGQRLAAANRVGAGKAHFAPSVTDSCSRQLVTSLMLRKSKDCKAQICDPDPGANAGQVDLDELDSRYSPPTTS